MIFAQPGSLLGPRPCRSRAGLVIFSLLLLFAYPAQPLAQSLDNLGFESRLSVAGTLAAESEGQRTGLLEGAIAQRKNFEARTGVSFGIDNQIQYLGTNSGKKPSDASSNAFRIYGTWRAVGQNTSNDGTLVFKVEN